MENREFISAANLPTTEAEEVEVLCVENGEMKRKPGASLGGGEKTDLVLALSAPLDYGEPTAETTTVTIESGSLEAVAAALADGRPPVVKCKRYHVTKGFNTSFPILEGGVYDCDVYYYGGGIACTFCVPPSFMMRIAMAIDDPDYLEVLAYPISKTMYQVI